MANYDVTTTLAGQFSLNAMSRKEQKIIEILGKQVQVAASGSKPTVAQWNTAIAAAVKEFPPTVHRDMQSERAAVYWQLAVNGVNSGIAVAGQTESQILANANYLAGLDEATLDSLSLYLEGRAWSVLN